MKKYNTPELEIVDLQLDEGIATEIGDTSCGGADDFCGDD